jgi:hypothetical protein
MALWSFETSGLTKEYCRENIAGKVINIALLVLKLHKTQSC